MDLHQQTGALRAMYVACATNFVLFQLCQVASGHFLWLQESTTNDVAVTFGAIAGRPSSVSTLKMIAEKVVVSSHDDKSQKNVSLTMKTSVLGHSQLVGHVEAVPPFSLRLYATYGIWKEDSLLQYWSAADVVTNPNDWFYIQDWAPRKGLEITIRDPWMKHDTDIAQKIKKILSAQPGDECQPHQGPWQNGAACVVGVVRFDGELLDAKVSVETFAGNGAKLNVTEFAGGVVILKVPVPDVSSPTPVWAKVNYHEKASGTYEGKNYASVDHWATTFSRIQRAGENGVVI